MSPIKCPVCGQSFPASGVADCPYCGASLAPGEESDPGPGVAGASPPFPPSGQDTSAMTGSMLSQINPLDWSSGVGISSLPWSKMRTLLKRSPPTRLEGTLVSVHTQQEETSPVSLLISALMLLKDLVWPSPDGYHGAQKRTITMLRVRTHSGLHRDARVAGEPRGALLVPGDNLSLWGRYWRGVFVVSKGFNHTSEAEIYSSVRAAPLIVSLIVMATLLITLLLLCYFWLWPHLPLQLLN